MPSRAIALVLIFFIVIAHIFLWRSDMEPAYKLIFTLINAVAWTIVLAPIFLIDRWLDSIKQRNAEGRDEQENPDR